jgi:hypothetical protein
MYSYFLKLYVHYKGKQKEAAKVLFPHLHARLLSCTKGVSNCNGLLCLFYPFEEQLVFFFFLLVYDVYLYMFTSRCLYDDAGKTLSKLCPRSKSVETREHPADVPSHMYRSERERLCCWWCLCIFRFFNIMDGIYNIDPFVSLATLLVLLIVCWT